jgi:circadian clock protein KaiC
MPARLEEMAGSMAKKGKKGKAAKGKDPGPTKQPTGIVDLDEILLGGVRAGNTVLVSGPSGTGKTTTCFEIMFRGAAEGLSGVIYLTSETPDRAITNLGPYEFFNESMVNDGKVVIKDISDVFKDLGIAHPDTGLSHDDGVKLLEAINKDLDDAGATYLVIDSLTAVLAAFESDSRVRSFVKELSRTLTEKGITAYLTSELAPDSIRYASMGVEDAMVDGVILLGTLESRGDLLRSLSIIKMRGTEHSRSKYVMDLTQYGLIAVPFLKSYAKGGGE